MSTMPVWLKNEAHRNEFCRQHVIATVTGLTHVAIGDEICEQAMYGAARNVELITIAASSKPSPCCASNSKIPNVRSRMPFMEATLYATKREFATRIE